MNENHHAFTSAVFLTFSGNCKKALTFYQSCFGGVLKFEKFGKPFDERAEAPIVNGSLISNNIVIYGSDLVHHDGRKLGNYMAIFLHCKNTSDRRQLLRKLNGPGTIGDEDYQKLIEITDEFDVRWILGVS